MRAGGGGGGRRAVQASERERGRGEGFFFIIYYIEKRREVFLGDKIKRGEFFQFINIALYLLFNQVCVQAYIQ